MGNKIQSKANKSIKVSDYYGNPSYYSCMPVSIFDALESAFLNDEDFALVSNEDYDTMLSCYDEKMKHYEKIH